MHCKLLTLLTQIIRWGVLYLLLELNFENKMLYIWVIWGITFDIMHAFSVVVQIVVSSVAADFFVFIPVWGCGADYRCQVFFIAVNAAAGTAVWIPDVLVNAEAVFFIGFKLDFLSFHCL